MPNYQDLIGNAIKFHHPERSPVISISAQRIIGSGIGPDLDPETPGWVLTIGDNGIGIEAEYFERMFQVFQRLHTREEYAGTGIGLAVCEKIVARHGGRIRVESTPGEGTAFHVFLPDEPPVDAVVEQAEIDPHKRPAPRSVNTVTGE